MENASIDFSHRIHFRSQRPANADSGPHKRQPAATARVTEDPFTWSPCELMRFLRDLSSLNGMELDFLLRKDTIRSTRLLRVALRVSAGSLTHDTIYNIVSSIHRIDHSIGQINSETRQSLYEVIVDLVEYCMKHKAPISMELWEYNLLALKALAAIYKGQKEPQRARHVLEKAVQYELKVAGTGQVSAVAETYNELARLCVELQDAEGALHHYQQALQIQEEEVDHPLTITTLQGMARLYFRCGMYNDALSIFHHILILQDIRSASLLDMASTLCSIGLLYNLLEEYNNALYNYHEALTMLLRHYGGDCGYHAVSHFDITLVLNSIGMIHCEVGNYEEACRTFQKCASMHLALAEPEGASSVRNQGAMSAVFYNLAVVYMQKGNEDIAEGLFRKSIALKKSTFGAECGRDLAVNLRKLGKIHFKKGEHRVAVVYLEEAVEIMKGSTEFDVDELNQLMLLLAILHLRNGSIAQMMLCLCEASRESGGLDHVYEAFYESGLSMLDAYSMIRIRPSCAEAA